MQTLSHFSPNKIRFYLFCICPAGRERTFGGRIALAIIDIAKRRRTHPNGRAEITAFLRIRKYFDFFLVYVKFFVYLCTRKVN